MKYAIAAFAASSLVLATSAQATSIVSVDPTGDPSGTAAALAAALLAPSSGVSIVGGSESYIGAPGQGGTYSDFSVSNGSTTIALANDGVVLTSGSADDILVADNTLTAVSVNTGTGGNAQLQTLTPQTTGNQNALSFDFTVEAGITSVSAQFVFATDEYPDQSVTDIFGVFVDGVNYAEFSDGSVINFELGSISSSFFNNNNVGVANPFVTSSGDEIEYDGILSVLTVTALLDASALTHSFMVAIADTFDTAFDSGVFFGGLLAGTDTGGGITDPSEVPLPAGAWLMLTGIGALAAQRKRKKAQKAA